MSTIDNDEYEGVTIDGEDVQEITIDGDVAWVSEQIVDDFESYSTGNIDLMNTYEEGAGSSSNFIVTSNGLLGSSKCLTVSGGSTQSIEAESGDGSNLDNYINNGDTFRFAWEMDIFSSGKRCGVWYSIDTSALPAGGSRDAHYGAYRCWVESDSEIVSIENWSDYSGSIVAEVSISGYSGGETWECEVTWDGSNHDLTVYNQFGSVVGSDGGVDSEWSVDGTVGYSFDDDDPRLDEVRIV